MMRMYSCNNCSDYCKNAAVAAAVAVAVVASVADADDGCCLKIFQKFSWLNLQNVWRMLDLYRQNTRL